VCGSFLGVEKIQNGGHCHGNRIQYGRHSKPMMNINSQHHNLLGSQILPKLEDFCIWWPFCTLVTMAVAAILNFFNPQKAATHYSGYSNKVS
jgi:hypothetical protein